MRNKPPFSCPQCGDTGIGGEKCLRCKIAMLDQQGLPPLAPPAVFLGHPTLPGFFNPWGQWASAAVFIASFFTSLSMESPWPVITMVGSQVLLWVVIYAAYRLRKGSRIAALQKRLKDQADRIASAPAATPISSASGNCRIRGRVKIITPVKGPLGTPVAAFLERRKRDTMGLVSVGRTSVEAVTEITVEEMSACGVLVVQDESGSALIDDDAFTVAQLRGVSKNWDEPLSLVVNEGDEIEIIGKAERKTVADLPEVARQGGYREAGSMLVFDGKPEERVLVLASSAKIFMNG